MFKKFLLIEPNMLKSRAQVVSYLCAALVDSSANIEVNLLLGWGYDREYFCEILNSINPVLIDKIHLHNLSIRTEKENRYITFRDCLKIVLDVIKYRSNHAVDICLYCSFDECRYWQILMGFFLKSALSNSIVVGVKYRIVPGTGKITKINHHMLDCLEFTGLLGLDSIAVFDERFVAKNNLGLAVSRVFLEDPWIGKFTPVNRNIARACFGFYADDNVLVAIGRQTKRKGISIILEFVTSLLCEQKYKLLVVGAIDDPYNTEFLKLKRAYPSSVIWIPGFVDENDLPRIFAAGDLVLMPYDNSFTSTSGVLTRSVASGVPVITYDRGLVGWRVRKYELGIVVSKLDDSTVFSESIRSHFKNYSRDSFIENESRLKFVYKTSMDGFRRSIQNALEIWKGL